MTEIRKATKDAKKLTWEFILADRKRAKSVKNTLAAKAGVAKRDGKPEIYNIYSRAARRLKTPKTRR